MKKAIDLIKKYSYLEYQQYVETLFKKNEATGTEQSQERLEATYLNIKRTSRLLKTAKINDQIKAELNSIKIKWKWILILEGWCGDGAQIAPYIYKTSSFSSNISLEIILRDENPEFMDNHLTNGTRSIPKLICFDNKKNLELVSWGPRPKEISLWVKSYKTAFPNGSSEEFKRNLHLFYHKNKGEAINNDLLDFIYACKKAS